MSHVLPRAYECTAVTAASLLASHALPLGYTRPARYSQTQSTLRTAEGLHTYNKCILI